MKSATELLTTYIHTPHMDPDATVSMFAENGVLEAPYFASFGLPWRFEGHRELRETFAHFYGVYPELRFENLRIVCECPGLVVGEYEFIAQSRKTGRMVHQLSIATLVESDGKIKLLREFQNVAEIALAILPGGLNELNISGDRELAIGRYSGREDTQTESEQRT